LSLREKKNKETCYKILQINARSFTHNQCLSKAGVLKLGGAKDLQGGRE